MEWAKKTLQTAVDNFRISPGRVADLAVDLNLVAPWNRCGPGSKAYDTRLSLLGIIHPKELEKSWQDMLGTRKVMFPGRKWDHVLLFPFWEDPGHLAGFYCVGKSADGTCHVFLPVCDKNQRYTGLYGLPDFASSSVGGLVAINDTPTISAALQMRNSIYMNRALPLVSWLKLPGLEPGDECWKYLSGFNPVFWGVEFSFQQLYYAAKLDAKISVAGPSAHTREEWAHYFRADSPTHILRSYVSGRSRAWPVALQNWARTAPSGMVDDLLFFLLDRGYDLNLLVKQCTSLWLSDSFRRVKESLAYSAESPKFTIGKALFEKINECWYVVRGKKRSIATDFTLDVYDVDSKAGYYHCMLVYHGEKFEFPVTVNVYNSNRLKAAIDQFLINQAGRLPVCNITASTLRQLVALSSNPVRIGSLQEQASQAKAVHR